MPADVETAATPTEKEGNEEPENAKTWSDDVATAAKRRRLSVEERVAIVEGIHGKNVLDPDSMDSGERSAKLLQTLAEYLAKRG